jgi:hypothetical protein
MYQISMENVPSLEALKDLSSRLKKANIKHALGGSGLLYYLGLTDTVNDWDITTDAPIEKVTPLLSDLKYEIINPSGIYDSKYLCKIKCDNASIDLIGEFAIKAGTKIFRLPTLVTADWDGIPIGSPAAWAKAYELMGRHDKSKILNQYLKDKMSPT